MFAIRRGGHLDVLLRLWHPPGAYLPGIILFLLKGLCG